ncbi:hypothetical protein [Pseudoalteromonas sp. SA25]|uniref:hypothetical protein n=1 Tax=Pseudoalteromonas sp. SA25 TaxID=2686347 RepID=UPI001980649C|nr:hypothetical protein [Pseudoalteromonas sp. SA25]
MYTARGFKDSITAILVHVQELGEIDDDDINYAQLEEIASPVGIEYFVIHDLRRSCRSLLAQLGVPDNVAERCLNHKIEGVYNRYDYFDERQKALNELANVVIPLIQDN